MAHENNDSIFDLAEFQALLLSLPIESTKYSFMSMLLARALNLKDEAMILAPSSYKSKKHVSPVEILPQIAVPGDLWLASDIGIRDLKVKIALLKEVNAMLLRCLGEIASGRPLMLDEALINALASRVEEYKLTEFTASRPQLLYPSFREDDEYESDTASVSNASFKELVPDTDDASVYSESGSSRPGSFSGSRSSSRVSTLPRDFMLGKRKLSFFGHTLSPKPDAGSPTENRKSLALTNTLQLSPSVMSSETFGPQKSSQINGLLSKSKFYNKLVKRRDLQALASSSTTTMAGSAQMLYRNSASGFDPQESHNGAARNAALSSATQRIENQKDKYRFYAQTKSLGEHIQLLAACFDRRVSQPNLIMLMEFVKNYVFKFVVVDICQMILAKAHMGLMRDLLL